MKMLSATGRTTLLVHTFCPPPVIYIGDVYVDNLKDMVDQLLIKYWVNVILLPFPAAQ